MIKIIFKIFSLIPNRISNLLIRLLMYSKAHNLQPKEALHFLFSIDKSIEGLEDINAIRYDNGVHAKHRLTNYHRFFIENIEEGSSVLDIGCGIGALASDIAQEVKGCDIVGIDLNKESIDFAKKNYKKQNLSFIQGDATKDLPSMNIDIIILSNVLEHIEFRTELLLKLNQIYQPSMFLIRVPMYNRDWRVPMMEEIGFDYRMDKTHFIEYTIEIFEKEIIQSGLMIKEYKVNWGEIWAVIK